MGPRDRLLRRGFGLCIILSEQRLTADNTEEERENSQEGAHGCYKCRTQYGFQALKTVSRGDMSRSQN